MLQTLRTDFHMALDPLSGVEILGYDFTESVFESFWNKKETLTLEKYQAMEEQWRREAKARAKQEEEESRKR